MQWLRLKETGKMQKDFNGILKKYSRSRWKGLNKESSADWMGLKIKWLNYLGRNWSQVMLEETV